MLDVAEAVPSTAIAAWQEIVGVEHVISSAAALRAAETATFATDARIPLIVRPGTRLEVQACVRVANAHGVPIYPISSGRNWGYGSRVPASDGNVLLDLGRMQRIIDFSEPLAYATVEPGVTQQQLHEFLRARGSRLWMDATGASPSCSLIGNTMERGFGHTPYGDHFAHVCALEVVLADGSCADTGFARFGETPAAPVYRWGLGPALDGLFTQSNLGIVTRMTIWLMPAPERFEAFFFRCDADEQLPAVIDALRELRLSGTLRSAVHIGNDYKVLNGLQQYPWDLTGGETPLRPEQMREVRRTLRIGVWNGSGGLYGTRAQVAEARRVIRNALQGKTSKLQFIDDRKLRLAQRFARPYRLFTGWDLSATIELLRPVYGLLQGIPTTQPLSSAYWRKRTPPPTEMDPDRDGCGLLWCAPVAPLEGGHARDLTRVCAEMLLSHGFEPMLSLSLVTERALTCVISITYDRDVAGEDERALRCYRALLEALDGRGYHSYRLGVQSGDAPAAGDTAADLLSTLKRALDPHGILAPGRYGIGGTTRQSAPRD